MRFFVCLLLFLLPQSLLADAYPEENELLGSWIVVRVQNPFEQLYGSPPYQLTKLEFRRTALYQITTTGMTPANYRLGKDDQGNKTINVGVPSVGEAQGIYSLQGDRLFIGYGRAGNRPKSFALDVNQTITLLSLIREKRELPRR